MHISVVLHYKIRVRNSFPQTRKSVLYLCVVYLTALSVAQTVGLQHLCKPSSRYSYILLATILVLYLYFGREIVFDCWIQLIPTPGAFFHTTLFYINQLVSLC
jgi:hypothetical protein